MGYTIRRTLLDGFLFGYLAIIALVVVFQVNSEVILESFSFYSAKAFYCFLFGTTIAIVCKMAKNKDGWRAFVCTSP